MSAAPVAIGDHPTPIFAAELSKRGHVNKRSWTTRWFELHEEALV